MEPIIDMLSDLDAEEEADVETELADEDPDADTLDPPEELLAD